MSKFSISISDADRAELDAQAQALGKSKSAHATDMLRDGLSRGESTIQALDLSRAQLRATELKLRQTIRLLRDGKVAEILGTATGPAWSSALLGPKELRAWWFKLGDFVGVVDGYGVQVSSGWWLQRYLVEALAAGAAWWHELEEPGGDAAAGPSDKVSFLRWVGGREDVRAIAAAHTKELAGKPRKTLTPKEQKAEQDDFKVFVDNEVNQRRARPRPGVPPVEVGEDGMSDFARMVEGKEDMFARMQKEYDASKTPKRDRPGVDHAAIEAEAARRASEEA